MANVDLNIFLRLKDQLSAGMGKAGNAFQQFRSEVNQTQRSMMAMTAAALGPAGLFFAFKSITTTAIDFESAFAGVRKTVDATEGEFAKLRDGLIEMSTEIPIAAKELAKIQTVAGQLGVRGVDNLEKFTKTVAILGETTDIVGETGALQLARFLSILGESEDNIDRAAASIVQLGNNFRTQEAEMLDLALNLASFGSQIGLSAHQVLAFATTIKGAGGQAQAASAAFQKVALTMKDAVITGNENLAKFAKVARLSSADFKKAFEVDAGNAINLFLDGLNEIDKAGGSVMSALSDIGLADLRLVRELGKVIKQIDVSRKALDSSSEAWGTNNAHLLESEERFGTTESKITLAKNEMDKLSIAMGEVLLPAIRTVVEWLSWLLEGFEKVAEAAGVISGVGIDIFIGTTSIDIALGKLDEIEEKAKKLQVAPKIEIDEERMRRLREFYDIPEPELPENTEEIALEKADIEKTISSETQEEIKNDIIDKQQQTVDGLRDVWTAWNDEKLSMEMSRIQKETEIFNLAIDTQQKAHESLWPTIGKLRDQFSSGVSKMLTDAIKGTVDWQKAFADLGMTMVSSIIEYGVQLVVNTVLAQALQATQVATATATGTAIASAYAPAAAMASLATMGGNAAPASAALASVTALAQVLAIPKFAEGTDSVPAMVSPREMIFPTTMADAIRRGDMVVSGRGGFDRGNGGSTITGDTIINFEINNPIVRDTESINEMVNAISTALADEAERI